MTARSDALDFLIAQCAPLYRPAAGASVDADDVVLPGGATRPPNETDTRISGTYTAPTGTASSALLTTVDSPTAATLNVVTKPAYQGLIKGRVLLAAWSRASGYASPLTGTAAISIIDGPDNPPFDDAVHIFGTLPLASPEDYRVELYAYTMPYHTLLASDNVAVDGSWDIGTFTGAELVDNLTGQYPEFRFRVIRIADGVQIGAQWSNQVDMRHRLAQDDYRIVPYTYTNDYYVMTGPAVADAEPFVYPFVRTLDLSYIFNVAWTGPPAPNYHVTGQVSARDADNNLDIPDGVSDGLYQIEAKYNGVVLGYFDVIGGAFDFFHADNDQSKWEFRLIRLSDSAVIGGVWKQTYANIDAYFITDAFGFGGTNGTEWRLRLTDDTLVDVADEEWQASSGNVAYYDNLVLRFCDVTDREYGLTHQRASALLTFVWDKAPSRRAVRMQLATDVEDPITGLPAPQAEWTMTTGLPRSAFYKIGDPEYGTPRLEGRVFTYDAALVLLSLSYEGRWVEAEGVALGLVKLQFSDGSFPFAAQQRYSYAFDKWNPTGQQAWVAYALLTYRQRAPLTRLHASIDIAIRLALAWLESMRVDATGLLRGGDGHYWPAWAQSTAYAVGDRRVANVQTFVVTVAGVSAAVGTGPTGAGPGIVDGTVTWNRISVTDFDPTYQASFHSTEHNLDAERAFTLGAIVYGKAAYLRTAEVIRQQLLALHWSDALGAMWQGTDAAGTPDGVSALDCSTWAGVLLERWGEKAKAVSCNAHADAHYQVVFGGVTGYRAFSEDDGVVRPDTLPYEGLWHEGSFGAMLLKQRLADPAFAAMFTALETLQQADGSFNVVEVEDLPDLLVRESVCGTSWYLLNFQNAQFWAETTAPGIEPAVPRYVTRIESWTDFPQAGGAFVAVVRDDTDATVQRAIGNEQRLSFKMPTRSRLAAQVIEGSAIVLRFNDGAAEPWRTDNVDDDFDAGTSSIACNDASVDVAEMPLLRTVSPEGIVDYLIGFVERTPAEYLIDAILPTLPLYYIAGAVDPTVLLTLSFDHIGPHQALDAIVDAVRKLNIGCEWRVRPIGDDFLAIDILTAQGENAPLVRVEPQKHTARISRSSDTTPQTTRVIAFGKDKATMARVAWRCDVIDGTHLKLTDPDDGVPPISFDNQLSDAGMYVVDPFDGTLHAIVSDDALTNIIEIDDTSNFIDGDLVEMAADDTYTDVQYLGVPNTREKWGTIEDATLSGELNRIPNPVGDLWPGDGTTPPDGYTFEDGSAGTLATIERVSAADYGGVGDFAARIFSVNEFSHFGTIGGVRYFLSPDTTYIRARAGAVYSFTARVQINATHQGTLVWTPPAPPPPAIPARLTFQLERLSEPDDEFFPVAKISSDSQSPIGVPFDMTIDGIVLPEDGVYRVRMMELFGTTIINEIGTFDVVWVGWQLIEGSHVDGDAIVRSPRANRIWHLASYQLLRGRLPQQEYQLTAIEHARRKPSEWQHLVFVLGGTVQLAGVDGTLRIVSMLQKLRGPTTTEMTFVRADDSTSREPFTALVARSIADLG